MNITHLRYAVEVARTGSISQAAETLCVGQPNLSKAIKELESSLGVTLFRRTSKGATPTPQGEAFLHYARSLLSQMDEMENLFAPGHAEQETLRIAATPSAVLTLAVAQLSPSLPVGQVFSLCEYEDGIGVLRAVSDGQAGMGLLRCPAPEAETLVRRCEEEGLSALPLRHEPPAVLMSRRHPLAESRPLLYPELAAYTQLTGGDSMPALSVSRVRRSARLPAAPKPWILTSPQTRLAVLSVRTDAYAFDEPLPPVLLERYGLCARSCVGVEQEWIDLRILPREQELMPMAGQLIDGLAALWREAAKSRES